MKSVSKDKSKIYGFILMLILIICSADSIIVGTNSNQWAIQLSKYFPFLLAFVCIIYSYVYKIYYRKELIVTTLLLSFSIMLTFMCWQENSIQNGLFYCILIICGMLIASIIPFKIFMKTFTNIMLFLAISSIIIYLISFLLPSVIKLFPKIVNVSGMQYFFPCVSAVPVYGLVDSFFLRNYSIFREPGVFQMFLNIALAYYLFDSSQRKKTFNIIIYIIAIISTTSTTGIIALIIIIIGYLLYNNQSNKKIHRVLLFALICILFLVISGYSDKLLYTFSKLTDDNNSSKISRFGSITTNLKLFLEHPLFGNGPINVEGKFANVMMQITGAASQDNTNTILYFLSCYGILPFILICIGLSKLPNLFCENPFVKIVLFIFLLVILSGENWAHSYFLYIFLMYGYKGNGEKNENRINKFVGQR